MRFVGGVLLVVLWIAGVGCTAAALPAVRAPQR